MIYEYPKEFIVPVVYINDLQGESSYKHKRDEVQRDWKLFVFDEDIESNEIFPDIEMDDHLESKDMDFLEMGDELVEKHHHKNMFSENVVDYNLEDKNIKNIFKDIDEDYAISETMHM